MSQGPEARRLETQGLRVHDMGLSAAREVSSTPGQPAGRGGRETAGSCSARARDTAPGARAGRGRGDTHEAGTVFHSSVPCSALTLERPEERGMPPSPVSGLGELQ